MNNERIKTDAISDAVEIPEGATHQDHTGKYWILDKNLIFIDGKWMDYIGQDCFIWYKL